MKLFRNNKLIYILVFSKFHSSFRHQIVFDFIDNMGKKEKKKEKRKI